MEKEYSKQELIDILQQYSVDGKVSLENLSTLVFDAKFPEALIQNAVAQLNLSLKDDKRFKQLASILMPKRSRLMELQETIIVLSEDRINNLDKIYALKIEQKKIEGEIKPFQTELEAIYDRIAERTGQ